jgi:hypothetical protein
VLTYKGQRYNTDAEKQLCRDSRRATAGAREDVAIAMIAAGVVECGREAAAFPRV